MRVEELPIPESVRQVITGSGITELYPPQEEAIRAGALKGKNLVLASPTASGKTLIAELCALRHILERDGKILYLTPLRALANEKHEDFKKYKQIRKRDGSKVRVGISTGDYDRSDSWLGKFDIIVTTNEKADSLLRHRARWMNDISLVVADEVHLLNDVNRGPTLEVVLARLRQMRSDSQFLALSATIKNAQEAAEWLKAIPVTTEWRPVTLREGVLLNDEVHFKDGDALRIEKTTNNPTINLALNTVRGGGQVLVFAGTRRNSVNLAKRAKTSMKGVVSKTLNRSLKRIVERIRSTGEKTRLSESLAQLVSCATAFHHAGLGGSHRKIVERAFREGKIKFLTATPTLAFGVNLPARTVIIRDYRRYEPGYGYYPIRVLEYKQMAGRAGRPRYDEVGEAVLIARTEDERDTLMENYVFSEPERIWSKLAVERVLRSHVLATVAADFAKTEQGIYNFFARTFYAYQYDPRAIKGVIARILRFLYKEKMIEVNDASVYATGFGRRVSELYIDPVSSVVMREGFLNRASKLTDVSFLHMIARTPDMVPKLRPYSREMNKLTFFVEEHREEFMFEVPDEWTDRIVYEEFLGEAKLAWVLKSWMEEITEDEAIEKFGVQPGDLYRLIETSKWLLHASNKLAALFGHKDLISHLTELGERIEKGVKRELLPLTRLKRIGRVRARVLYNSGFRNLIELKNAPLQKIASLPLIGPKLAKGIKEQAGGFVKEEVWTRLKKGGDSEQRAITEY